MNKVAGNINIGDGNTLYIDKLEVPDGPDLYAEITRLKKTLQIALNAGTQVAAVATDIERDRCSKIIDIAIGALKRIDTEPVTFANQLKAISRDALRQIKTIEENTNGE